ncbi:MAG: dNTP triphosphohydrolase [Thermoplasmata archaeon]|nr:dNTP triphosphohydrolase [Thermoplasmata archaeon]
MRKAGESESPCDRRSPYQHDIGRIVHSKAFRRLKYKTQVFISYEGDHFRTRLTHTLEVLQIAVSIARLIGLNEDLVEAIALGHDLGHTPFGHAGEMILDKIMSGEYCDFKSKMVKDILSTKRGGFKHNLQSLRVVCELEQSKKHKDIKGLNLTREVRDGILKHTKWISICNECRRKSILDHIEIKKMPCLEAQLVYLCDEIAQRTHDMEDGLAQGLIEFRGVGSFIKRELDGKENAKSLIDKIKEVDERIERGENKKIYLPTFTNSLMSYFIDDLIIQSVK